MVMALRCPQCGARFETRDGRRVYCSPECQGAHERDASAEASDRAATERLRRAALESFEAALGGGRNG